VFVVVVARVTRNTIFHRHRGINELKQLSFGRGWYHNAINGTGWLGVSCHFEGSFLPAPGSTSGSRKGKGKNDGGTDGRL